MKGLEILFDSLLKRWWKPQGKEAVSIKITPRFTKDLGRTILHCSYKDWLWFFPDLRWIVSLESGLWQFVCDEQLYKHDQRTDSDWIKNIEDTRDSEKSITKYLTEADYRYRLLESALIPEKELGEFLLDNIIVEWNLK